MILWNGNAGFILTVKSNWPKSHYPFLAFTSKLAEFWLKNMVLNIETLQRNRMQTLTFMLLKAFQLLSWPHSGDARRNLTFVSRRKLWLQSVVRSSNLLVLGLGFKFLLWFLCAVCLWPHLTPIIGIAFHHKTIIHNLAVFFLGQTWVEGHSGAT